jgi:hypothetical protein
MKQNSVHTEDLDAAIIGVDYEVLKDGRTTVCTLTLDNGFTVHGLTSCADPKNFDIEVGKRAALQKARDEVWPFLGFRLHEKMHAQRQLEHGLPEYLIQN